MPRTVHCIKLDKEAEGLDFGLASQNTYRSALEAAGFIEIDVVDRNKWYQQQARVERAE